MSYAGASYFGVLCLDYSTPLIESTTLPIRVEVLTRHGIHGRAQPCRLRQLQQGRQSDHRHPPLVILKTDSQGDPAYRSRPSRACTSHIAPPDLRAIYRACPRHDPQRRVRSGPDDARDFARSRHDHQHIRTPSSHLQSNSIRHRFSRPQENIPQPPDHNTSSTNPTTMTIPQELVRITFSALILHGR